MKTKTTHRPNSHDAMWMRVVIENLGKDPVLRSANWQLESQFSMPATTVSKCRKLLLKDQQLVADILNGKIGIAKAYCQLCTRLKAGV